MGRIFHRYILKEVLTSWLVVTGALLVILLTNQATAVLSRAAENQFPREVVFQLIGLGTLQNLSVLMPVGLLLAVVIAFGRLYHENEMTAAQACGVGPRAVYAPVLGFAFVVAALVAWLTLELGPGAMARTAYLRQRALHAGQFAPIAPGRFRTFGGGDTVVYAQETASDGTLRRVFVRSRRGKRLEVALAQRARHEVSADGMTHTVTLYDGERYEGVPGSAEYRIMRFAENVIPVRVPDAGGGDMRLDGLPTGELLASRDPARRAELHWRLALPVMAVVLTLVAVPLSRLRPRQGRYARIWLAVLIYFVYSNLASAGRIWLARGVLPEWLGLWWVHAAVLLLATLVVPGPGWFARWRRRWLEARP
ncbi:MAG: LPS export ABC transporter permease LptF [Gammaproteobacteria bacterium]|nr:LPS export ABC transporter permease LptF [Gammaproteobacteria bacterium]